MKTKTHTNFVAKASAIAATACLIAASLAIPVNAEPEDGEDRPFPKIKLAKPIRGNAIPAGLGDKLAPVAEFYGKTENELRSLCARDHDLCADKTGRLFYACEGVPAGAAPASGGAPAAGPLPYGQTFLLHSRPGASKVIYLDFNGHTTTATLWNTNYTGGNPIVTPSYSIDLDMANFSNAELDNIQTIWQRVAEDYAPYEVDVTTEDPGVEKLRKTSPGDVEYGIRVVVGGSSLDWFGQLAGGVAYLASFDWNSDTPVFVFPDQLAGGAEKVVAEAASHEVGHSFALSHDGVTGGPAYYEGHADWAPIMGLAYYKDVSQFSKGDYPLANNTENDLAGIAAFVPYRADQHGDLISTATPLPAGTSPTASGVIEQRLDADLFGFSTGAGPISFVAVPAAPEPNLNIRLSLYNGVGTLLASEDPVGMASTLNYTAAAGTYYLATEGVGTGSPLTGYDDYGSLGQFSLAGSLVQVVNQSPVAVATSSAPLSGTAPLLVNFSSAGSSDPDGAIVTYNWDFGDGGTSNLTNPQHSYAVAGNYVASLVVYDNLGASGNTTVNITVTPPGLPSPWVSAPIGSTGVTGNATHNSGIYTVTGGGSGYLKDGTSDNFQYVYQPLTGDGSITVRLNTLQNTGANTRVGIVIRETLSPGSRSAFMGVNGTGGFTWVSRANASARAVLTSSGSGTMPNIWLRLLRKTDGTIEGYKSTNGTSWTRIQTVKFTTPQIYVGLAISSGTSGITNTSAFNSVTVVP